MEKIFPTLLPKRPNCTFFLHCFADNGKIDFREFLVLVSRYEHPLPAEIETKVMFDALDQDRNGFVDAEELRSSFGDLGIFLSFDDIQEMMAEANVEDNRLYYPGLLIDILQCNLIITQSFVARIRL